MIDLHSHTDQSDGTFTPTELVDAASGIKLEALAITDHDTFSGYEMAGPAAKARGLELIAGIEISTSFHSRSVHLLAYFLNGIGDGFLAWIKQLQDGRHERNRQLLEVLNKNGFNITEEELRAKGKNLPGRPHFATLMVEKGYVQSLQEAFDKYLSEGRRYYVPRFEPGFGDAVERVAAGGGISSLAHPVRLTRADHILHGYVAEMKEMGLAAIEVFHSDHTPDDIKRHAALAREFDLGQTGGSDFHGATKPKVSLGGANVPGQILEGLRQLNLSRHSGEQK